MRCTPQGKVWAVPAGEAAHFGTGIRRFERPGAAGTATLVKLPVDPPPRRPPRQVALAPALELKAD